MKRQMRQRLIIYSGLIASAIIAMLWIDVPMSRAIHEHSFGDSFKLAMRIARFPGDFRFTIALALFLVWRSRCPWETAGLLLVASAVASGATAVLKLVFGRTRPFKGPGAFDWSPMQHLAWNGFATPNLSFPSGDATLAFATATIFAAIVPRWRFLGFSWAVLVAVTRILQGAHYASDVIVGALVGVAAADFAMKHFPTYFGGPRQKPGANDCPQIDEPPNM